MFRFLCCLSWGKQSGSSWESREVRIVECISNVLCMVWGFLCDDVMWFMSE